jgi:hypothetical protein
MRLVGMGLRETREVCHLPDGMSIDLSASGLGNFRKNSGGYINVVVLLISITASLERVALGIGVFVLGIPSRRAQRA